MEWDDLWRARRPWKQGWRDEAEPALEDGGGVAVEPEPDELATLRARVSELEVRLAEREAALAEQAQAVTTALERAAGLERQSLDHLRRALLAEHRGEVVAELVEGESPQALLASVERARAAWNAAVEAARRQLAQQQALAREGLSPLAKSAHGLQR